MSNLVLTTYRGITPVADIEKTDAMLRILVEMTPQEQQANWLKSEEVGYVCRFTHPSQPGYVLEYVLGREQDSVTTLYRVTSHFGTLLALEAARKDLIREIGVTLMALPGSVEVFDAGRNRKVVLKELGTAQLMDVLAHFTRTDLATV